MRITKRQLRSVIREERLKLVREQSISRSQRRTMDRSFRDYDETLAMFEENFPYELEKFIDNILNIPLSVSHVFIIRPEKGIN